MMAYTRKDGHIVQTYELEGTGNEISFRARDVRRERTGVHATIAILHGEILLTWSRMNVERHEDRTRLGNTASGHLPPIDKKAFPADHLKHALDLFCAGLWRENVQDMTGELMAGDPDVGPPKRIVGPYLIEGGGTILYAPPGRGKSYLALAMAVSLDSGCDKVWPVPEPRPVLFVNMERSRDSLRYRLARVNGALALDQRRPLMFVNARGRSMGDILDGLAETIRQHEIEALFLDSISRGGMGDLSDATTANRIVDALNALCPTWVALAHTPRSDESHIFGSVHFEAGEDIGVRLITQASERVTGIGLDVTKANDMARPALAAYALIWGSDGLEDIRAARRHEFPEIEAGKRLTLAEEIAEYLELVGLDSGTKIATEIKRPRQNVSSTLCNDSRFVPVKKEGRVVLYGLRAPKEYDTSSDISRGPQI